MKTQGQDSRLQVEEGRPRNKPAPWTPQSPDSSLQVCETVRGSLSWQPEQTITGVYPRAGGSVCFPVSWQLPGLDRLLWAPPRWARHAWLLTLARAPHSHFTHAKTEAKWIAQGHIGRMCGESLLPRVGVLKPGCTVESPGKS